MIPWCTYYASGKRLFMRAAKFPQDGCAANMTAHDVSCACEL